MAALPYQPSSVYLEWVEPGRVVGEVGEEMRKVEREEGEDARDPDGVEPEQRGFFVLGKAGGVQLVGGENRAQRGFGFGSEVRAGWHGFRVQGTGCSGQQSVVSEP